MSPAADCLLTGEERMWSHVIWRHAMAGSENGNLRVVTQSIKVSSVMMRKMEMKNGI